MNQSRIEFAARALSPFIWNPESAQCAAEPHAFAAQRERSIRRVARVVQALEEWDRMNAAAAPQ